MLTEGITAQVNNWATTRNEKNIASQIIRGFGFAKIARLSKHKENTSRLQAISLYAKAGECRRTEFVAEIIHVFLLSILGVLENPNMKT